MTHPQYWGSISTNDGANNSDDKSEDFIHIDDVEGIVDGVGNSCNLKLFLIVSESGSIGQTKEVDHIVEDEGQTADKGELVRFVFEDECDYVGETYVGCYEEEKKST